MLRDETIRRVIQFRDDREWRQFHTPKDLAISLSLEAAELLEIFQWSGANLECRDKLGRIREELADVLSYCVLMADVCGLDLDEILNAKVDQNAAKYPVEKARGSDPYELFLSGSVSLLTVESPNARTDRELVIFRDSFASSLAPLLLEGYSRVTLVDIRYLSPTQLGRYLTFTDQDVLFLYSTGVLNNSSTLK